MTEDRTFKTYKNRLIETARREETRKALRFNTIEYLCSFPKIDPYEMAASIKKDGITILFDDSSITVAENQKKERKVNKILAQTENTR